MQREIGNVSELHVSFLIEESTLRYQCQGWVATEILYGDTVELQWLEHLWNHENMFERGVVRANEC